MPLTLGLLPSHLDLPAFPMEMLEWSWLDSWPIVAQHFECTILISPDGSLRIQWLDSFPTSCAKVPAERASCPHCGGALDTMPR